VSLRDARYLWEQRALGIIHAKYHDAFLSYAHDDNVLHDDAVRMFQRYFKPIFEAEFRLQAPSSRDADIFMDTNGLPANGDLSNELRQAIGRTAFLIIFVGKSYPQSTWCGKELETFTGQFPGAREEALRRTFVIVLDRGAELKDWGEYLENPERPIFLRFYDEATGTHIPPMLEDTHGQAVPGPRFLGRIRRIAQTMAERALELSDQLH
jgi:hypothetical protein